MPINNVHTKMPWVVRVENIEMKLIGRPRPWLGMEGVTTLEDRGRLAPSSIQ